MKEVVKVRCLISIDDMEHFIWFEKNQIGFYREFDISFKRMNPHRLHFFLKELHSYSSFYINIPVGK